VRRINQENIYSFNLTYKGLVLILFSLLFSIPSIAARKYPGNDRYSKQRLKVYKAHWAPEKMTNPYFHDDQKFDYIVNIVDGSLGAFGRVSSLHYYAKLNTSNPSLISNNPRICASYINQDHRELFTGQIGLILKVPEYNFGPMSFKDLGSYAVGSYTTAVRYFNKLFKQPKQLIFSPADLARKSRNSWNEMLIMGHNEYYDTKVGSEGAILRCKNWKSFVSKHGDRLQIQPGQSSAPIDLVEQPEVAFECLTGSKLLTDELIKNPVALKADLLRDDKNSTLTVDEMRAIYLLNLRDYILHEDKGFQVILFEM
tara:strand:+ start:77631 stop:78569 length:939 start_codon:yes stop_codon:yes gene_type:complete